MVAEEIMVTLSGGAPWGFRLQGGAEQQTPLQVAKLHFTVALNHRDRFLGLLLGCREVGRGLGHHGVWKVTSLFRRNRGKMFTINSSDLGQVTWNRWTWNRWTWNRRPGTGDLEQVDLEQVDLGQATWNRWTWNRRPGTGDLGQVRRRSKACRGGLRENDELVAIGQRPCAGLSHADAMSLIDTQSPTLSLKVKRAPPGFLSPNGRCAPRLSPCAAPSPSPRAASLPPAGTPSGVTSPPDSEAYDGETDSDADTQALTHRRQRRTPPHARSPARYDNQDEEETSEMSGYESATDAGLSLQGQWDVSPHREPLHSNWTGPEHTPNPHTLTAAPADQAEAEGEGDSGFQEVGVCSGLPCPPLVSPERAKEALMLGHQLVPMVGPQQSPVNHELSTSYMDKARQASEYRQMLELQRGESQVEKQVKEARTKCRSIASLLTDAPNPNSKGVLMFKKRRQRAKKFTLTCFGKAEGDRGGDTEGETEEEGGSSIQSGSEVDEAGFSASFDPTWDAGYLDLLDRRSSACPSTTPTTPTTPTANRSLKLDPPAHQPSGPALVDPSPGLEASALERSASQGSGLENRVTKQPIDNMSPPAVALTNGGSVAVSRASVVLSAPSRMPLSSQNGHRGSPDPSRSLGLTAATDPDHMTANVSPNQSVLNRTARPFTPGTTPSRPTVTSVMFRPPQPKPAVAVSMVTIQPTPHAPEPKRAVSSTSLYIPSRNNSSNAPPLWPPPPQLCHSHRSPSRQLLPPPSFLVFSHHLHNRFVPRLHVLLHLPPPRPPLSPHLLPLMWPYT
ncbi:Synaptopodin 2-like protein [Takifugu flavidus]|uniref:Synaptopodin 2-like protein n=1 Tax=Takifugu flavidus TaxID=433684 RepID=A0A5C6PRJ7_9TELE|nr:Synaptopodin 2-like protein [Takifugu flavidus]